MMPDLLCGVRLVSELSSPWGRLQAPAWPQRGHTENKALAGRGVWLGLVTLLSSVLGDLVTKPFAKCHHHRSPSVPTSTPDNGCEVLAPGSLRGPGLPSAAPRAPASSEDTPPELAHGQAESSCLPPLIDINDFPFTACTGAEHGHINGAGGGKLSASACHGSR